MQFTVDPVWNWTWVCLAACVLIALVLRTYPARVRTLPVGWQRMLIALRLLAACILILLMLRPSLQISEVDHRRSELAVLFDSSRSMQTPDEQGGQTRRAALVNLWRQLADERQALEKELDLKLMDFSDGLKPVTEPAEPAEGKLTAIGKVIDQVREQSSGDRLIGILLLSDGAQRAGGDDDVDPLLAARRLIEEKGAAIHPVQFGTSELSTAGLDLSVEEFMLDQPVTFERKTVPVRAKIRLQGAAGKTVRVQLLMEDRTGRALGQSGLLVPMPLTQNSRPFVELQTSENAVTLTPELSFIADQAGDYKIAVEVVPVEGEIKLNNNRMETLLTVRKGGMRVAYFDTLRIEQKFLRELNDTAQIQLDTQFIVGGRRGRQNLLDPKLFAPESYDVYLIGDVPAQAFQTPDRNLLDALAMRVREGAGLAMLGGVRNFSAGGYGASPLSDLLPVKLDPRGRSGSDPATGVQHAVRMLPTRDGDRKYLMQLATSQNDQAWRQLPELSGATRLVPKSGAVEILAESEQGDPLLIAADNGKSRSIAFALDETWKWHLHGHAAEHQRFWQQMLLWLARKEFESDQPVWVRVEPRNFPPMAAVPIECGARDAQGQPLEGASFEVEVIRPDGKIDRPTAQQQPGGAHAEYTNTSLPGDYWVRVNATQQEQAVGVSAMTRFIVDARDLELDQPAADPTLLSELAMLTGGTVIPKENLQEFLHTLLKEGIPSDLKRTRRINLWDNWPLLLLFAGTMSLEWTLRKWKGLV